MDQESSCKGKLFLLCIACCVSISLWLFGCAHSLNQWQGEQDLKEAKDLMGMGDYSASEKKALGVNTAFPQALGDEALFQMGLLYTLPKNPNADYEKSRAFFEKLVTLYPDSSRKEESVAWLFALNRIVDNEKETFELQKKLRLLEQTSEAREKKLKQLQGLLETRQKGFARHRNTVSQMQEELEAREKEIAEHRDTVSQMQEELEAREKEIAKYQDAVSRLQDRVTEYESQLAKFKNIDLTIEQKKRVTTP
jgi:tetratricopeptide (TPR) repeat protein